jgi:hypothetical protein
VHERAEPYNPSLGSVIYEQGAKASMAERLSGELGPLKKAADSHLQAQFEEARPSGRGVFGG